MKKKFLKHVSMTVAATLLATTTIAGFSASEASAQSFDRPSLKEELNQKSVADSYVKIEGERFVLENKDELLKEIGEEELNKVVKTIDETNEMLGEVDFSEVTVKGNAITSDISSDEVSIMGEGVTKIEVHWNYARVWLSRTTLKNIKTGLTLGGIWIPNWVIGGAASTIGILMKKPKHGIWFDFNYLSPAFGEKAGRQ